MCTINLMNRVDFRWYVPNKMLLRWATSYYVIAGPLRLRKKWLM